MYAAISCIETATVHIFVGCSLFPKSGIVSSSAGGPSLLIQTLRDANGFFHSLVFPGIHCHGYRKRACPSAM